MCGTRKRATPTTLRTGCEFESGNRRSSGCDGLIEILISHFVDNVEMSFNVATLATPEKRTSHVWSNLFHRHMADVELLNSHGVAVPQEWVELRSRFTAFTELSAPVTERLAAEILAPSGADIEMLRAAALAETATSIDMASVSDLIRSRVHSRLVEIFTPHADRAYKQIADRFDTVAAKLARAARTVNVEADPSTLVKATAAARTYWFDGPILAAELDECLSVLVSAGRLAGMPAVDDEAEIEIPLSVDVGKIHKRELWTAWHTTTGRCRRWSALLAVGAEIQAHKRPRKLQPFTQPRPLQQFWQPGEFGGYTPVIRDPEDNTKAAVPEDDWSIA